jgi:hypothetical protein
MQCTPYAPAPAPSPALASSDKACTRQTGKKQGKQANKTPPKEKTGTLNTTLPRTSLLRPSKLHFYCHYHGWVTTHGWPSGHGGHVYPPQPLPTILPRPLVANQCSPHSHPVWYSPCFPPWDRRQPLHHHLLCFLMRSPPHHPPFPTPLFPLALRTLASLPPTSSLLSNHRTIQTAKIPPALLCTITPSPILADSGATHYLQANA